ncbi:Uncharacterised protein [Chlamydia trachomatis]|nr:Uncharacterised protein [Chlamydia trachomatis]
MTFFRLKEQRQSIGNSLKTSARGETDIEATFFISAPYTRLSDLGLIPKTSPHTTKAPPLAPHTPTRPSMRKRSQLTSVTTCTPRDKSRIKHAKPSHQVQLVHKNQPHDRTTYTPRDETPPKQTKPSHQVQLVHKNQPHDRTNYTPRDASGLKYAKLSH